MEGCTVEKQALDLYTSRNKRKKGKVIPLQAFGPEGG